MRKLVVVVIALALLYSVFCRGGASVQKHAGGLAWTTDFAQGMQAAEREKKPVLVDFMTTW